MTACYELPILARNFWEDLWDGNWRGQKSIMVFPFWADRAMETKNSLRVIIEDVGRDAAKDTMSWSNETRTFAVPKKADQTKWTFLVGRDRSKIYVVDFLTMTDEGFAIIFTNESGKWKIIGLDDNHLYDKMHN